MASKSKSKWAEDDDEEAVAAAALRKQEKEEKKRLKEEKAHKASELHQSSAQALPHVQEEESDQAGPSSKRRKTSPQPEVQNSNSEEGTNLLQFPNRTFGPSEDVQKYELLNNIEEGSYGLVSRALTRSTGEVVALKRLKMDQTSDGFPVTGLREIQTLLACQHTNIVNLREVVVGGGSAKDVYLVMDFLEHDLKTLLEDMPEPFLPSEIKTLMLQITSATSYLHTHYIMHRDLKTSNLLLNNRGEIKLADFGMARYTRVPPPSNLTQLVVTLWYRAPELLLGITTYSFEIDIWSLGCIFAELLTRDPIFQGKNEVDQLSQIFSLVGPPTNETWPGFRSLPNAKALHPILSKSSSLPRSSFLPQSKFPYLPTSGLRLLSSLLSLNPASRPTAAQILEHPYFREDPRPKPKEMFPTFPSKAGQEKRRRKQTPQAPVRGQKVKELREEDFERFEGFGLDRDEEERGAGFALRLG